jgi:hypothetical protein
MTGFVMCIAGCYSCKQVFEFNPHFVPSIRIDGEREPICRSCMNRANMIRVAKGEPAHPIHPEAYEPLPAEEL